MVLAVEPTVRGSAERDEPLETWCLETVVPDGGDRRFESFSLQRRVINEPP
jgi:hypothetical protein